MVGIGVIIQKSANLIERFEDVDHGRLFCRLPINDKLAPDFNLLDLVSGRQRHARLGNRLEGLALQGRKTEAQKSKGFYGLNSLYDRVEVVE